MKELIYQFSLNKNVKFDQNLCWATISWRKIWESIVRIQSKFVLGNDIMEENMGGSRKNSKLQN